MCRGTTILCKTVCSECVTCTCLCACVCLQFSRIWSAFMWIIITLWRFFSLPSLRPHLQQRQIVEEGWRPNFLVLSLSPLSLCFCLFLSAVCLCLSLFLSLGLFLSFCLYPLSFCRSSSSMARTTYVWSLGWTQNHCYQRKCTQTSHNDFHLEPVHKHSQMHRDTLSGLRQADCMLFSSAEAAVT